jgi:4-hydroxybenzoate polyprenyltransferase
MPAFLQLMRPRQWVKNFFVLAPLFFGLELFDAQSALRIGIAFIIFCLLASAMYVFNDLHDAEADKLHPKKRLRPIAAGAISQSQAMIIGIALLVAAVILAVLVDFSAKFYACLAIYTALSVLYSLGLKRVNLVEIFIVASGYVIRVLAGCAAIGAHPSVWILSATGVIALLIVAGKRRSEIEINPASTLAYSLSFLDSAIGILGAATIVTYLLFTTSDYATQRYGEHVIGTAVFVMYGVLRYVQLIKDGKADDPTTLVLKDNGIRLCLILWVATFFALIYWRQ